MTSPLPAPWRKASINYDDFLAASHELTFAAFQAACRDPGVAVILRPALDKLAELRFDAYDTIEWVIPTT